jgi:hypothetical protein
MSDVLSETAFLLRDRQAEAYRTCQHIPHTFSFIEALQEFRNIPVIDLLAGCCIISATPLNKPLHKTGQQL